MRVPWLVRVVWQPEVEFDLLDKMGKPDHGKVIGFFIFASMFGLFIFKDLPSLGHTIALMAAGFGWVGFRTFLRSKRGDNA